MTRLIRGSGVTDTLKPRAILAKAYRDNGDLGAANYVEAGHDLMPDTQIALLAIQDALGEREALIEALERYGSHPIGCAIYQQSWVGGEPECSCGLDSIRNAFPRSRP